MFCQVRLLQRVLRQAISSLDRLQFQSTQIQIMETVSLREVRYFLAMRSDVSRPIRPSLARRFCSTSGTPKNDWWRDSIVFFCWKKPTTTVVDRPSEMRPLHTFLDELTLDFKRFLDDSSALLGSGIDFVVRQFRNLGMWPDLWWNSNRD